MELLQVWKGLTACQGTYDAQYALNRNMMRERWVFPEQYDDRIYPEKIKPAYKLKIEGFLGFLYFFLIKLLVSNYTICGITLGFYKVLSEEG